MALTESSAQQRDIYIYAELLENIQLLSLTAVLPSPQNETTTIELASDRETLTLHHNGSSKSIKLPCTISESTSLSLPPGSSRQISLRFQLESKSRPCPGEVFETGRVPWLAPELQATSSFRCYTCNNTIIEKSTIREWKDLPNESWAEMMDFWHCHKPDDHNDSVQNNTTGQTKGYAAGSKIIAQKGIGLVDPCFFLFKQEDCSGIVEIPSIDNPENNTVLECQQCHHSLGTLDVVANGYKLYKWGLKHVSLSSEGIESVKAYPITSWISTHLLALANSHVNKKFHLHCPSNENQNVPIKSILIWLFLPSLHYSSTRCPMQAIHAIKALYQPFGYLPAVISVFSSLTEEVTLPEDVLNEVLSSLKRSTSLLPKDSKKIDRWDVGLMERF